jgi:hypothetical protein
MGDAEVLIAGLLVAVVGPSSLARRLSLPYPIVLVLGGAVLGFVPGLPSVELDPDVVLVVFLPPLLYGSSIYANFNDFRADLRWLTINTIALVLVTLAAVAATAHALIPGLSWAAAFVLGAILPDRSARRRGHHAPPRRPPARDQRRRRRGPALCKSQMVEGLVGDSPWRLESSSAHQRVPTLESCDVAGDEGGRLTADRHRQLACAR